MDKKEKSINENREEVEVPENKSQLPLKQRIFLTKSKGTEHFGDFGGWCKIVDNLFNVSFKGEYEEESKAARLWKYYSYKFIKDFFIDYQVSMRALDHIVEDRDSLDLDTFIEACHSIRGQLTPMEFSEPEKYDF